MINHNPITPEWVPSICGPDRPYLDLRPFLPPHASGVVLAHNRYGLRPCGLFLSHQLYPDVVQPPDRNTHVWILPVTAAWMRLDPEILPPPTPAPTNGVPR